MWHVSLGYLPVSWTRFRSFVKNQFVFLKNIIFARDETYLIQNWSAKNILFMRLFI